MTAVRPRQVLRASGFAALAAVVLFGAVGFWAFSTGDAPRAPYAADVVAAGGTADAEGWSRAVVWGAGAGLRPAGTECSATKADGSVVPLVLGVDEPRATAVTVRNEPGASPVEMVTLGEVDHLVAVSVSCSGAGLESFALGESRLGPPMSVVGGGFLVLAGVAAAWAAATLLLTRRRS